MRTSHHSGIATALVLLVLLAILFWDKLSAIVTSTVAGTAVPDSTKTMSVVNMVQVPLVPDNVPIIQPYTPGSPPDTVIYGTSDGHLAGIDSINSHSWNQHIITGPIHVGNRVIQA